VNRYTNKLSKILEEFPPGEEEYRENSCLRTGTLTDSKGFCENSGLGKGISGKTSGFIGETYSRPERVW
jgi:hypothetical protein